MRQVPKDQILRRVQLENPWWHSGARLPGALEEWTPRPYLAKFLPLIWERRARRAVVLMGSRRVGKTVLLHHAIRELMKLGVPTTHIAYFSVDHPILSGLSLEELLHDYSEITGVDFETEEVFVFFDEIQYLKNWEGHLKSLVDGYPSLRATVSGSAAAALRLKSSESGAGRFTDFLLPPLTFYEYLVLIKSSSQPMAEASRNPTGVIQADDLEVLNEHFVQYLNFGGYPEAALSVEVRRDPGRFIKNDIVDKVLLRDLPSLYGIQDIQELNYLFTTLAFNTAGEVSLEELSKGSGVAKNTIKRYIEYLEAAFLIRVVHRVDRNGRRFRRASNFKVYLTNPSIRAALFSPAKGDDPALGSLVETAIFSQWFHSSDERLHYARWKKGEVDLVGLGGDLKVSWAVEVKWSDRFAQNPSELKAVLAFCRENKLQNLLVTTRSIRREVVEQGITILFVPASEYSFTVGYNLVMGEGLEKLPGL